VLRLLVADDTVVSRKILARTLEDLGHDVVCVANGAEAWERLRAEPIRLVVTDWVMPELSGVELTRKIRNADFKHYVYVILVSSRCERADRLEGLEAGGDDYVTKPFDPAELAFRVRAGERVVRLEEQLALSNERLRRLTLLDELTGVGNRRAFEQSFRAMGAAAERYGTPLGLAMIDIDRFKQYNDTLGHDAGDRLLRIVADLLKVTVRTADLIFRYGGDEFASLFPMTDGAGAAAVTERLRARVHEEGIPHPDNPPHGRVTVSVGYSCTSTVGGIPAADLLQRADGALYASKRAGRDRVSAEDDDRREVV
jgi:diguanylate cyclase (GGDEF)-like protein